jgi:hypothetical protein
VAPALGVPSLIAVNSPTPSSENSENSDSSNEADGNEEQDDDEDETHDSDRGAGAVTKKGKKKAGISRKHKIPGPTR